MIILWSILGAIAVIFLVVLIHEWGHFIVARWCGVRVLRFSIGFGKPIWRYQSTSGTEYVVGILPFGGYVKMEDEAGETAAGSLDPAAFSAKSVWQRIAITLAGPAMNFLLAIVLFWAIFWQGFTVIRPVIGHVAPASPAAKAGIQPNDEIVSVGGIPTRNWQRVLMGVVRHAGESTMQMTVRPLGSQATRNVTLHLARWRVNSTKPQFLKALGITPVVPQYPAVIAEVIAESPAMRAGLLPSDRITSIDGLPVKTMIDLIQQVQARPNAKVTIGYRRAGRQQSTRVVLGGHTVQGKQLGFLGVRAKPPVWPAKMRRQTDYTWYSAWSPALEETALLTLFQAQIIQKMVVGDISFRTLGGPISVFKSAGQASQSGLRVYLSFIAFISLMLGFINLLPIPGLDGGHLLFYLVEVIIRRPISARYQILFFKIGITLLILLMVVATVNDLSRWFLGG